MTANTSASRLVDSGLLEATDDQPQRYVAREIALTVTAADGAREGASESAQTRLSVGVVGIPAM